MSGQVAVQWIERKLNEYFNELLQTKNVDYVIYIDTDGLYLDLGTIVEKHMPGLSKNETVQALDTFFHDYVEPFMSKSYQEFFEYMNNREQLMIMDRECIADVGIWSAKKRYLLNVHDNEGVHYAKPKLKVMGYSFIKSDIPEICRKKIFDKKQKSPDLLSVIIRGTNGQLIEEINKFRKEWNCLRPDQIAKPSAVNGIQKYSHNKTIYKKGTMAHIRGSILYNHLLIQRNLTGVHSLIHDGDKIKYLWLNTPNPIGDTVISFPNYLPQEFELDKYVDYESAFQKQFLDPLDEVLTVIGWNNEKRSNLMSFMSRKKLT